VKFSTHYDLFSGIGGFSLAFDGEVEKTVHVEIDKDCQKVLAKAFPDHQIIGDIKQFNPTQPDKNSIITGGFPCFPAGTLINTSEGYKPIESLVVGDLVETHMGRYRPVKFLMNKKANKAVSLSVLGAGNILATEEHPFYIAGSDGFEWTEAKDLKKGSLCTIPVNSVEKLPTWDGVTVVSNQFRKKTLNNLKDNFSNHHFWWVLGRILADGWLTEVKRKGRKNSINRRVVLCCGFSEIEEVIEKLDKCGLHYTPAKCRTTKKFHIYSTELHEFLLPMGKGAKNKQIPQYIQDLPIELLKSYIDGYLSGDGCYRDGRWVVGSVSQKLILGLQKAINKAYRVACPLRFVKTDLTYTIEGRGINQSNRWELIFHPNAAKSMARFVDGYVCVPVREVGVVELGEMVYNIEVEEDNSYCVNNIAVHNCQAFSRNGKGYNLNNRTVVKSDDRANLFLEVVRLLQTIQPQLFIAENVKELLTIKSPEGELMIDIITDAFKECGYSVRIEVLCPTDFGIPQQRKRVFILGERHDSNLFFAPPSSIISPPNAKVLDLLEENVDPSFLLKNLWKNRTLNKNKEKTRLDALIESYNSRNSEVVFNNSTGKIQPVAIIYGDTPSGLPRQQDKLYSCWGICPTLATFSTPAFDHHNGWRILTPKECLRLQSFPDTHPISDKKAAAYKQTGNAVNVKVVNSIIKRISEKSPSESN